ncbi:hypothetical protein Tsubulata_021944 [Turnera subulata]|uniref:peptidylprolyl isomerase n=1 Tax=Turnera subulata TaxID=218843 RepID=A0A9Q0J6P9_9ROSI|nr:hypothetical protein Tsubulata_021944 [Turnera subulata]
MEKENPIPNPNPNPSSSSAAVEEENPIPKFNPSSSSAAVEEENPIPNFNPSISSTIEKEIPDPIPNPRVYFDITIDGERIGRMVMELDAKSFPKTAENFRALCTGEKGRGMFTKPLHFKGTRFYQVRPQFFCCGGDMVENDGTGGESIFGEDFDSEEAVTKFRGRGDLSMCYVDGWHSSRFFITFVKCAWMNGNYPVFGQVVEGLELLDKIEAAANKYGRVVKEVVIVDCGECTRGQYLEQNQNSKCSGLELVLIMDEFTVTIMSSSACKMTAVLQEGVSLVEAISQRREPMRMARGIHFIQPSEQK